MPLRHDPNHRCPQLFRAEDPLSSIVAADEEFLGATEGPYQFPLPDPSWFVSRQFEEAAAQNVR